MNGSDCASALTLMTFGSDLVSIINSDPAWKVVKGYRSSSRRPRKTVDNILKKCEELVCEGLEDSDMPLSDAEKRGVSALGCRFSKEAEHVPIKKRRFMFRSPSPPPVEETSVTTNSQDALDKHAALNTASDVNSSQIIDVNDSVCVEECDKPKGKFGQDEDFSGISILAAAACSSSLGREYGYVEIGSCVEDSLVLQGTHEASVNPKAGSSPKGPSKEDLFNSSEVSTAGTSSCISSEPVGDLASILTAVPSSEEVKGVGKGIESASLGPDSLTSCCKVEEMVGSHRSSSCDGRLHWDLNVVMDNWEEPSNDSVVHNDISQNKYQGDGKGNHDNKQPRDHDLHDKLTSASAERTSLMPDEPKALGDRSSPGRTKLNLDIGLCFNIAQAASFGDQSAVSNTYINQDSSKRKAPDHSEPSASTNGTDNVSPKNFNSDKHLCSSSDMEGSGSRVVVLPAESENCVVSISDVVRESERKVAILEDVEVDVSDGKTIPHSNISGQTSNIVSAAYDVSIIQGGNLGGYDASMLNISEVPPVISKESHDSHFGETMVSNVLERKDCRKTAEGEDDLGGVQGDTKAVAGEADEFPEGYDFQYEDGELNQCARKECEGGYGEAEHVNNGSDNTELFIVNPSDHHNPDSGEVEGRKIGRLEVDAVGSSVDCIIANEVNQDLRASGDNIIHDNEVNPDRRAEEKMKIPAGEELRDSSKNLSDMAAGLVEDNNVRKDNMHADADGLVEAKGLEISEEPKASRSPLQSRIEAVGVSRDEQLDRFEPRSKSASMRSFDRGRYTNPTRGQPGGNWVGSTDNRRYRRPYSPVNFRHSKIDDDSEDRDEVGCGGRKDNSSYSHQLTGNDRPGGDEMPCSGVQSRYRYERKFSPDRCAGYGRGRPFRYGPSMGSGGRGRYNGPSQDESFQSSLKYRRLLSNRERSLSPFGGRGQSNIHNPRGMSPSLSRSRSPVRWNSPRGRPASGANTFNRHRSRSPNFRSDFRMQRLRSPNQQPGFSGDHVAVFRSTTRNRGSPHNRWNSGRRDEMSHFREFGYKQQTIAFERSPGGIRLRGDRDDVINSPRNLKPEGYYKVSDRISEDCVGRGHRYEDSYEDQRKPFLRPVRRSYEDRMASRLHHDNDGGYPLASNMLDRDASSFQGRGGFRSIDTRVGESRRIRGEEQYSFMSERGEKFNSDSKQFEVDVMDSPRKLKSEEHYCPYHTGRYSDMNGTHRRFDAFEERRKYYYSTNLMRHCDNETEEGQNHEADEKSQNAADFCGRDARGLDGRIGTLSTRR